ncbi:MAG: bifunctional diaminohydroxyphosphoribosylaminopyrimidine deaminase/5-amino-6-(5-phosphoribosylamino)uracil reductase RibD, partial [Sphingobacteriia bacterium]
PCAHQGKTPPCSQLILKESIPQVVVACRDPFPAVNGKGLEQLTAAGVEVKLGVLEKQARQLNAGFFHFHEKNLPLVTLKWASSADGFMAELGKTRTMISDGLAQAFVHRLRANHMAILVGFNTALYDNPLLTNRSGKGKNPLRIVVDPKGELPADLQVFQGAQPAWRFQPRTKDWVPELLHILAKKGIQSILVEGGKETLDTFLAAQAWDRLIQVQNTQRVLGQGLAAPQVPGDPPHAQVDLGADRVHTWVKQEVLALPDHFYSPA